MHIHIISGIVFPERVVELKTLIIEIFRDAINFKLASMHMNSGIQARNRVMVTFFDFLTIYGSLANADTDSH